MQSSNTHTGVRDWSTCTNCRLHHDRRRVVVRNDSPRRKEWHLLFIGDSPGRTEDVTGIPFTGDSYRILHGDYGYISYASEFTKRQFSWTTTNLVCCRPEDRQPVVAEANLCKSHIDELIQTVKPDGLIYLGVLAKKYYPPKTLPTKLPILSLAHPAMILREEFKLLPILREARKLQKFIDSLEKK